MCNSQKKKKNISNITAKDSAKSFCAISPIRVFCKKEEEEKKHKQSAAKSSVFSRNNRQKKKRKKTLHEILYGLSSISECGH